MARTSPAQKYVPGETVGDIQPQAAGPVQAAVTGAVEPADIAAASAESAPAAQAPAATASPSPSPSSPSGQAAATTPAAANPFNPLPVFFTIAGVLIAAGLVWVIRPLRASVLRIAGRKAP
ncbi:MAG TPA: hypothetical protein VK883_10785 [Arthrobacter sp.]|nr:hypothetical protein [Arthrobacter sp.]